jgi:hypothetical protein
MVFAFTAGIPQARLQHRRTIETAPKPCRRCVSTLRPCRCFKHRWADQSGVKSFKRVGVLGKLRRNRFVST